MNTKKNNSSDIIGNGNVHGSLTITGNDENNTNGQLNVNGEINLSNSFGSYTIIPIDGNLGLRDNQTGKIYRFVLKEVK